MVVSVSLRDAVKFIGLIILIALFFIGGITLQKYLSTHQSSNANISKASPTPSPVLLKDPVIAKEAQDGFTQFLNYMKTTGTQDMKLTDYNNLKLDQIYIKGAEVHAIFLFSAITTDSRSQQKLITSGGTLQKNGWVTNAKGYIILTKQNNTYATKVIYLKLPDSF